MGFIYNAFYAVIILLSDQCTFSEAFRWVFFPWFVCRR